MSLTVNQIHKLQWIFLNNSEIGSVNEIQLHQIHGQKNLKIQFLAWLLANYTNYTGFFERTLRYGSVQQNKYINYPVKKYNDSILKSNTPTTIEKIKRSVFTIHSDLQWGPLGHAWFSGWHGNWLFIMTIIYFGSAYIEYGI